MSKILLLGASGSGTTSTARLLAAKLGSFHGDSDFYFWQQTNPPYEKSRPIEERKAVLKQDLENNPSFVLSGSFSGWGDFIIPDLTHVFFLTAPTEVRIQRLIERESDRFGKLIEPGGIQHKNHEDFLIWATAYETGGVSRTRALHLEWLAKLPVSYHEISTDQVQENVLELIKSKI